MPKNALLNKFTIEFRYKNGILLHKYYNKPRNNLPEMKLYFLKIVNINKYLEIVRNKEVVWIKWETISE